MQYAQIILVGIISFAIGVFITSIIFLKKIQKMKISPAEPDQKTQTSKPVPGSKSIPKPPEKKQFLGKKPIDVIDNIITRSDIQRNACIGLEYHLNDLIEELKTTKDLQHLIRIVIMGYEKEKTHIWEIPEVQNFFYEIDKKRPELIFFFEDSSLKLYFKLVEGAKLSQASVPINGEYDVSSLKQQLGMDKNAFNQKVEEDVRIFLTNLLPDEFEKSNQLGDDIIERIKKSLVSN